MWKVGCRRASGPTRRAKTDGVRERFAEGIGKRGAALRAEWARTLDAYAAENPEPAAQIEMMQRRQLPDGRVPRLLINELTPRGSGNHPDVVELKALAAGNVGGAVLYLGTPGSYDARLVFPPLEVAAGSFLVVHLRPSGDPGEVDETTDMAASAGFDASDTAFDFWMRDGKGLGGNNGVVSLFDRPGGTCLDGVLYSNRTVESDELYAGFGSEETRARAEELAACGAWAPAGARITPEDGVNPEGSTGTRSLCRSAASDDSNRAHDWHIVPTRRSTIGARNSDEVYVSRSIP